VGDVSEGLYKVWGDNIANWRKARNISREAMAKELVVSLATISRWENGKVMPRDELKLRIADYLEIPAVVIFPLVEVPS
jgi:transcriptional regulator with XRE-family HTH domain